ncbi:MAG TPA: hypothetical protein VGW38_27200, partial [Chloroflexota bacterium]|nr:hypothetical protein [Chloroflexota bacterium]
GAGWMNRIVVLSGAAVAAIGLLAWQTGAVDKLTDQSHGAIAACEESLLQSLRSPSTYERVAAEYTPADPLSYEDYVSYMETRRCPASPFGYDSCVETNRLLNGIASTMDWENPGSTEQVRKPSKKAREAYYRWLHERYGSWPVAEQRTAFVSIEYDAANAFNAPLRSTHVCRFGPIRSDQRFETGDLFGSADGGD